MKAETNHRQPGKAARVLFWLYLAIGAIVCLLHVVTGFGVVFVGGIDWAAIVWVVFGWWLTVPGFVLGWFKPRLAAIFFLCCIGISLLAYQIDIVQTFKANGETFNLSADGRLLGFIAQSSSLPLFCLSAILLLFSYFQSKDKTGVIVPHAENAPVSTQDFAGKPVSPIVQMMRDYTILPAGLALLGFGYFLDEDGLFIYFGYAFVLGFSVFLACLFLGGVLLFGRERDQ